MSASVNDKITDVRNSARPNSARVSSSRSAGVTTLACDNLTGWPTVSKVHFVTYQIDSNSNPVDGTQLDCYGIVSGSNIGSFTVVDGTDNGNAVGDVVEMLPTAAWGQDFADAMTSQHSRTGAHTAVTTTSINNAGTLTQTGQATFAAGATVGTTLAVTGATTLTGATTVQGNKVWQYLNSATYTGGTVTSSGATPTLITSLTVQVTIPTSATAVRITVDTSDLYVQTGAAVATLAVYSGATSGALTTQLSSSTPNIASGTATPGHVTAFATSPTAGAIYYSAALSASASNARIDSSATSPALLIVEVC